jgi:hypothetical protein
MRDESESESESEKDGHALVNCDAQPSLKASGCEAADVVLSLPAFCAFLLKGLIDKDIR